MILYEQYSQIKHMSEDLGLKSSQIAQKMELDERTIQKWIEAQHYIPRKSVIRQSKLDPFKKQIQAMLEKYPYSSIQILMKIKEQGYTGGKTILTDYVLKIRPPHKASYLTLHFMSGECAQVDWGYAGLIKVGDHFRKMNFFVMVLCYSRMMYLEFTLSQAMEFFLGCHQNAFQFFGGVPEKIMIDNLKTGVVCHRYGEPPVFNPTYLNFSQHYGFKILACNAGKGNEKGRVENGVRYVKINFLKGLEVSDFKFVNPLAKDWLHQVANIRIHGETHRKPIELFEEEKKHLQPINLNPYDIGQFQIVRANHQFRVTFESNRYSVPYSKASSLLDMKRYPNQLLFYKDEKPIAQHIRSFEKYKDFENPDHVTELLKQKKKAKDQKIYLQFLNLSPDSERYYRHLEEKRLNPKIHLRKIVALTQIYGNDKVAQAIHSALEFEAFSSDYIENLLEQQKRFLEIKEESPLHITHGQELLEMDLPTPDLNVYLEEGGSHESR